MEPYTLVPVIIVFTKYDALELKVFRDLMEDGYTTDDTNDNAPDHAKANFKEILHALTRIPLQPRGHVYL